LLVLSVVDSSRYFAPAVPNAMVYESLSSGAYVPAPGAQLVGTPPAQEVYVLRQSGAGPASSAGYLLACCAVLGVSYLVAVAVLGGSLQRYGGRTLRPARTPASKMLATAILDKHIEIDLGVGLEDFDMSMDSDDGDKDEMYVDFGKLFGNTTSLPIASGSSVRGTVTSIANTNEAYVEWGGKSEAVITFEEAVLGGETQTKMDEVLSVGEEYEFQVLSESQWSTYLTRKPILATEAWEKVTEFAKEGQSFMATVIGANAGGVIATHEKLGGLTGFIPGSMIAKDAVRSSDGTYNNDDLIGTELEVKIQTADKENNRLVLSNRAAVVEKAMKDIHVNALVEGTVISHQNFGVFVDVAGVRGMIHVSEVSALFVDPALMETLLPVGSKVKAVVKNVDLPNGKLGLSTRALESSAGEIRLNPETVFANAEERMMTLQEQWRKEAEMREKERMELESQIMDLTMSVFGDGSPEEAAEYA
jgi:small subunit ribosomal protein S1